MGKVKDSNLEDLEAATYESIRRLLDESYGMEPGDRIKANELALKRLALSYKKVDSGEGSGFDDLPQFGDNGDDE